MRKLTVGLLIFMAGWWLSRFTYNYLDSEPLQPAKSFDRIGLESLVSDPSGARFAPKVSSSTDDIGSLLQRNEIETAVERYESVQDRGDDAAAENIRLQILAHARLLIAEQRFSLAEKLLQRFMLAAYRDVEAALLLGEAYLGKEDHIAAIDQFYEVRGYAYRPHMLQRINSRIRSTVIELTNTLNGKNDQAALLALYQRLTQLEPDHAPWFIGLAGAQLALDDTEAARRSLLLVSRDPDVGARAQAMLSELAIALARINDTQPVESAKEVVGIPLYRHGNHFIVDAKQGHGRNIRLLIDTGASLTMLSSSVLEQGGMHYQDTGRTAVFNTANGPIRAPVYKLDSLSVGDWQVNRLEIGVLDSDTGSNIDGLLGMNFLRHFQFFIDQNEAMLLLSVN